MWFYYLNITSESGYRLIKNWDFSAPEVFPVPRNVPGPKYMFHTYWWMQEGLVFLNVCMWHKFLLRTEPQSSSFLVMWKGHSFPLEEYLSLQYIKSDLVHFIIPIFCLSNWGNLCEKPFLLEIWHWYDIYHFKIIWIIHSECVSWSLLELMRYTNFSKPLKIILNSWHSW